MMTAPTTSSDPAYSASERQVERWLARDGGHDFVKAVQIGAEGHLLKLQLPDGEVCDAAIEETWPVNPPKFERADDIADLTFLNEPAVIHNLKQRYVHDQIYTYSGLFLVAVNPYKAIDGLYAADAIEKHRTPRSEHGAPHVFAVAHTAWRALVDNGKSQAVLVTGESGAGKTENTKMVIRYLSSTSTEVNARPLASGGQRTRKIVPEDSLESKILDANPALEAFGNALTVRNHNSSRFGKYVRIGFSPSGVIVGATIQTYLLEKSRVTARNPRERAFHIFYQLLAGADDALLARVNLSDRNPRSYAYLASSQATISGVDDRSDFADTKKALLDTGLTQKDVVSLFDAVAVVLQLGNVRVEGKSQAFIASSAALDTAARLLGLKSDELKRSLVSPRLQAGAAKESVIQARSPAQVHEEIGALCKAVYGRTFAWLVERVNACLIGTGRQPESQRTIGVLDIAGFEIFESNSFEQLLINHTNERLQQLFNSHFFEQEQDLYRREGLAWAETDFGLNLQPTIDLIESSEPPGILATLDDESILPRGTDEDFVRKLGERHAAGGAAAEAAFQPARVLGEGFTIRHYAGDVQYSTDGWLLKNKDPLNTDLLDTLGRCSNAFFAALFRDENATVGSMRSKRTRKGAFRTVGQKHREDLASLLTELEQAQPHFVRCIVPNLDKQPGTLSTPLVLHQLRCNGVIEGLRIARQGYPNRMTFVEFCNRYQLFAPDIGEAKATSQRDLCRLLCERLQLDGDVYDVGHTRVFFKAGALAAAEDQRERLLADIFARFQASCRRRNAQRSLRKRVHRLAALETVQRNARVYAGLQQWPWWRLFVALRPLLAASQANGNVRQKDLEAALARQHAESAAREAQRVEELRAQHGAIQSAWQQRQASMEATAFEKDAQLGRMMQELEVTAQDAVRLREEAAELRASLQTSLNAQDLALAQEAKAQKELRKVAGSLDDARLMLAAEEEERRKASAEATRFQQLCSKTERERDAGRRAQVELEQKVQQRDDDIERLRSRLSCLQAEADASSAASKTAAVSIEEKLRIAYSDLDSHRSQSTEMQTAMQVLQSALDNKSDQLNAAIQRAEEAEADVDKIAVRTTELQVLFEAARSDAQSARRDAAEQQDEAARARQDLQALRTRTEARATEDSRNAEIATSLRSENDRLSSEIAAMRKERTEAERGQAAELYRLRQQNESLQDKLDSVDTQVAQQASAAKQQHAAVKKASEEAQAARLSEAAAVERSKRLERDLSASAEDCRRLREQLSKTQESAQHEAQQMRDLQDAIVHLEQSRANEKLQAEQLAEALQDAMDEADRQQTAEQALRSELLALTAAKRDLDLACHRLTSQNAELQAELQQSVALQDRKVVEHVHVLQTAKKLTDQHLAEAREQLQQALAREQQLEKAKARLLSEIDDLSRLPRAQSTPMLTSASPKAQLRERSKAPQQHTPQPPGSVQGAEVLQRFSKDNKLLMREMDESAAPRMRSLPSLPKTQDSTVGDRRILQRVADLDSENKQLKHLLEVEAGNRKLIDELTAEHRRLQGLEAESGEKLAKLQRSYQKQLEAAHGELDLTLARNAHLQDDANRLRQLVDRMEMQYDDQVSLSSPWPTELERLKRSLDDALSRKTSLETRLSEVTAELAGKRERTAALERDQIEQQRVNQSLRLQLTDLEGRQSAGSPVSSSHAYEVRVAALQAELEAARHATLVNAPPPVALVQTRLQAATSDNLRLAKEAQRLETDLQASRSHASMLESQCSRLELSLRQAETMHKEEREGRLRAEREVLRAHRRIEQRDRASSSPAPPDSPHRLGRR